MWNRDWLRSLPWQSIESPRRARQPWGGSLAHLVELARGYVEDKATDLVRAWEEWAGLDPADRLADVPRCVGECLYRPWRPDAGLFLDLTLELVVGDLLQAAVSVVDQDDLGGAEQPLANRQRPDHVVGDHPARVADHLRLLVAEAEQLEDLEPGVHAGDHGRVRGRPRRQRPAHVRAQSPAARGARGRGEALDRHAVGIQFPFPPSGLRRLGHGILGAGRTTAFRVGQGGEPP